MADTSPPTDALAPDADEGGTFPAGTALTAFLLWFVLARVTANLTVRRPAMLELATFSGVLGAVLAALAVLALLGTAARRSSFKKLKILHGLRTIASIPVVLLVFVSMFGESPLWLQWSALTSAAVTVAISALLGVTQPRAHAAARSAFVMLAIGELIELVYAPAQALLPSGDVSGAHTMAWLGRVAEASTFAGSFAALLWAYRASVSLVGKARTRVFLPFPVAMGSVLSALVLTLPSSVAAVLARTTFGARFDWLTGSDAGVIGRAALLGYLLAPVFLIGSVGLSMASVGFDHGAGTRRSLGWVAVLFAGFGVLRIAGPMDPIRLILVTLGAVLLERASAREAYAREAALA
ncbi:MAG: hypothetical protein Q8Q09_08245 [Deltaproteobacteria bacterium]|nr:hypothetical protein [Deltaproteobacteria bacterium]